MSMTARLISATVTSRHRTQGSSIRVAETLHIRRASDERWSRAHRVGVPWSAGATPVAGVAGNEPWFAVTAGDEQVVADHPVRTLLLVWPPAPRTGAPTPTYCTPPVAGNGSSTSASREAHAQVTCASMSSSAMDARCLACTCGVMDVPCTCGVSVPWRLVGELPLPNRMNLRGRRRPGLPAGCDCSFGDDDGSAPRTGFTCSILPFRRC